MAQEAITLDATMMGASSNSLIDLATAESHIHSLPFHDDWDLITDNDEKEAAILWASRFLCQMVWVGAPTTETQALPWPRTGIYDMDGRAQDENTLPSWLEEACSQLAFALATSDRMNDSGTEGFSKIKLGSIDLTIDKADRPDLIPNYIMRKIGPWIAAGGNKLSAYVGRA